MDAGFRQRLIDASLVSAESATSLQQQCGALEGRTALGAMVFFLVGRRHDCKGFFQGSLLPEANVRTFSIFDALK